MKRLAATVALAFALLPSASAQVEDARLAVPSVPAQPAAPCPSGSTADVCSTNWAGYVATQSTFKRVHATWTVRAGDCLSSGDAGYSQWIGIDGVSANADDLEQVGVAEKCTNGSAAYSTFSEFVPATSRINLYSVAPGDRVTVTLSYRGSRFTFSIADETSGVSSQGGARCPSTIGCARDTAEWITEDPFHCVNGTCTQVPFANFGRTSFAHGEATGLCGATSCNQTIDQWTRLRVDMVTSSGDAKATTGDLNTAGSGFKVRWVRA